MCVVLGLYSNGCVYLFVFVCVYVLVCVFALMTVEVEMHTMHPTPVAAARARFSKTQRSRILERLCDDYPDLEMTTIATAVQASHFDEEQARRGLDHLVNPTKKTQEQQELYQEKKVGNGHANPPRQSSVFVNFPTDATVDDSKAAKRKERTGSAPEPSAAAATAAAAPVFVANSSRGAQRRISVQENSAIALASHAGSAHQPKAAEEQDTNKPVNAVEPGLTEVSVDDAIKAQSTSTKGELTNDVV